MKDWTNFKITDNAYIACQSRNTRQGFCHRANLMMDGRKVDTTFCSYSNRTWESYTFESVLQKMLNRHTDIFSEEVRKAALARWEGKSTEETNSMFGSIAMVAKMGELFTDNQKEANDWKARMLKAGLGEGVDMPADWDSLSEDEKQRRLDGAIEQLKK